MRALPLMLLLMACEPFALPTDPIQHRALEITERDVKRTRPASRTLRVELTEQSVILYGTEPYYTVGFDRGTFRPCFIQEGRCEVRRSKGRVAVWARGASGEPVWEESE